jgi:hypothetical protein
LAYRVREIHAVATHPAGDWQVEQLPFRSRIPPGRRLAMNVQCPLPRRIAALAELRCTGGFARLLARRHIHMPREHIDLRLRFADGTTGRVYRETTVARDPPADPCVLVVEFRLRLVRGALGHRLFRTESLLNTPLFVGYPGYVSKLWLAHDEHGVYRGVYEWDGPARAEFYARCLWRVLALVSEPGSIHYRVLPGLRRSDVLADPGVIDRVAPADDEAWWRLVDAA